MSNEMQLSESAKAALLAAPSFNQGAHVRVEDIWTAKELVLEGLVGQNAGLTRKGSILTEKLKKARERELFGL